MDTHTSDTRKANTSLEIEVYKQICHIFGGPKGIAAEFDISEQAVGRWQKRVPANRVADIVRKSDFQLLASSIRPDLYPEDILKAEFEKVA